ncbi:MAG TPA: hypothetical protein VFR35_11995 [Actinoplanes sp.]|nr:hypothetical protein [Actinoplanes sp.]
MTDKQGASERRVGGDRPPGQAGEPADFGKPPVRTTGLSEALGYAGAAIAVVAGAVLAARSWADLGRGGQLTALAVLTVVLLEAGRRLRSNDRSALRRLASVLWLGSATGFAAFLEVSISGGDQTTDKEAMAIALGSLGYAGLLWSVERRVLQQIALYAAAIATVLAAADVLTGSAAVGSFGVMAVGAGWLELGRRGWLAPKPAAEILGALALIAATDSLYATGWRTPALILGVAVGLGLLVAGSLLQRTAILGLGVAALVLFGWRTMVDYLHGGGGPVALLVVGLALVAIAVTLSRTRTASRPRRSTRPPVDPIEPRPTEMIER